MNRSLRIVLSMTSLVLVPSARAQHACPVAWRGEATFIEIAERVVKTADYAPARARLRLDPVDSSATVTFIADEAMCRTIHDLVVANIQHVVVLPRDVDKAAFLSSTDMHFYRVGDYWMALLFFDHPGLATVNGWAPLMIFESTTRRYLGVVHV
jgi:hypothetical protein